MHGRSREREGSGVIMNHTERSKIGIRTAIKDGNRVDDDSECLLIEIEAIKVISNRGKALFRC